MRYWIAAAVALLLAVALWQVTHRDSPSGTAPVAAPAPRTPAAVPLDEAASEVGELPPVSDRAAVEAPLAEIRPGEAKEPEPTEGRAILLRADGTRDERANGQIKAIGWGTSGGLHVDLEVVEGRFQLPVDLPVNGGLVWMASAGGELAGLPVIPAQGEDPGRGGDPPPEGERFLLEFEPRGQVVLDVRSATTGAALSDVVVRRDFHSGRFPGEERDVVVEGLTSPFTVPVDALSDYESVEADTNWQIRAPGHAWAGVRVDLRGDHVGVELKPSGALEVEVRGLDAPEQLRLIVVTDEDRRRHEVELDGDYSVRLEHVATGPVSAHVLRGDLGDSPAVFAEAAGTLEAGEILELTLDCGPEASEPIQRFDVEVEVSIAPGWELEELPLHFELTRGQPGVSVWRSNSGAALEASPDGVRRFRYALGLQPAGLWQAQSLQLGWRHRFEVQRDGLQVLELSPPAQLLVEFTDADTGEPLDGCRATWTSRLDPPGGSAGIMGSEAGPEPGQRIVRGAAGRIDLGAMAEGYRRVELELALEPGEQTVEVALRREVGVDLVFLHEGKNLSRRLRSVEAQLVRLGPAGEPARLGFEDEPDRLVLRVLEPGPYRLVIPEIDGFLPVPQRQVEVPEEGALRLELELQTKL